MNLAVANKSAAIGLLIGAASGAGASLLWSVAIWSPVSELNLSGISLVVSILMIVLAMAAVIGSWQQHGGVLIVLFFTSFFPVGLYLLVAPHWLRWVGVCNLGYLVAGLLIRRSGVASGTEAP